MAHYDIYREQLANLHHGHALWEPDPGGQYDRVSVGDVGFIRSGRFHRLFNILLSEDDPSHELGVPDGFEKIETPTRNIVGTLPRGKYYSSSVRAANIAIGTQITAWVIKQSLEVKKKKITCWYECIFSGPIPASGSFQASFNCTSSKGAALYLPFNAHREDTPHIGLFRSYTVKHCESWFDFASSKGLGIDRKEDILLVTGCDRTQPWALAAFMESNASVGISLDLSSLSGSVSAPVLRWEFTQKEGRSVPYNYGQLPNVCAFNLAYNRFNIHDRKARIPDNVFSYEGLGPKNGCYKSYLRKLWRPLNLSRMMAVRERTMMTLCRLR
jgi:hypothetical protein